METPARLIVDLGRLDGGKTAHLQGALAREALELEDLEQLAPAGDLAYDLHGELMPGDEFLVRGELALPCSCTCGRCGGTFQKTYAEPSFCETYPVGGMESLDLTESVREGIMLALPTYPVCRETCKGVCLHCGKNLNTGACTCGVEGGTPFGEALQGFAPEQDA